MLHRCFFLFFRSQQACMHIAETAQPCTHARTHVQDQQKKTAEKEDTREQ